MGVDVKKKSTVPPLPAPTETETTFDPPSELGTDLSKPGDEKSSYSLPDDGTPVTIRTRGHRTNKSQTSLLIEYFEGGKSSSAVEQRKPSVRVRLTPSSKKTRNGRDRDHIQITETKTRKASLSRRATASPSAVTRGTADALSALSGDVDDAKSTNSYASATEESNVSRNPIDIEIDRAGHVRRRRPASPLIPTMESKASYQQTNMSDISAIPTDSFLDGSGNTASLLMSDTKPSRNRSPSRLGGILAGATAGVAATAAAEKLSATSRERDRVMVTKSRDKERKNKSSKSRTSSKEERHIEDSKSPRGRSTSSKGPPDTAVSAVDSSVLSSNLSQSHRSYDQHSIRSGASKASSINNPKLLETVEDAIRRLILPELNALKREQSKHKERRSSTTSSATSISRDEYGSGKRRSAGTDKNLSVTRDSLNLKERRDREARHDCEDVPSPSLTSKESIEKSQHVEDTPVRSHEHLKSMALGASLGGPAALAAQELLKSHSEEKRSRRRRRAEMRSRGTSELSVDSDDEAMTPVPPMPLMSETNHSEMTRTSILSAETDRPQSATEELTPSHDVTRSLLSAESSPTPTRNTATLQALGTQHANISHGDLRALPRHREIGEEPESDEIFRVPAPRATDEEYDDQEYYERSARMDDEYSAPTHYNYYGNTQDVPPPLKYVPYQAERRGLSPIPSVSGYTEGGSEPPNRDSRVTHRDSVDSPDKSTRHDGSIRSRGSILSNAMGRDYVEDDRSMRSSGAEYRNPGYTEDSELDHVVSGKTVRAVGANPDFVHPAAIESNVASLVDTSTVDESVLTGESGHGGKRLHSPRQSMATLEEGRFRELGVPEKSVADREEFLDDREVTPVSAGHQSRAYLEYEPDEYGRKVPMRRDRQSPTESEAAITGAAVGAAAAALRAQQARAREEADEEHYEEEFVPAGIQRNKSFKERTLNGRGPGAEPRHGADWYDEPDNLTMGFSGIPRPDQPMPDAEWPEDDGATNPSIVHEQSVVGQRTPRAREKFEDHANAHHNDFQGRDAEAKQDDHGFGISESTAVVAGAAALAGAVAMAAAHHDSHSRQASQDQGEEWYRNSEDRKRDTIVTNPYEGTSPIANLPGLNENLLGRGSPYRAPDFGAAHARSPLGHKVDEGYISQGPNKTPELQVTTGKGVDFDMQPAMGPIEDPFYAPHERPLSGLSGGVGSPLYDAATGTGIDRIESKDIMALMQHLMVRDAQRSARDTEILVTIVRAAAEMRNSFDDIKRMLADTEDVIITEVKDNTDRSMQKAINGPRPYPGSAARSLQGNSLAATSTNGEDLPTKRRNIFRRALKGLSSKGTNDLGRIEDMLNQLLSEVDVLKSQTAQPSVNTSNQDAHSFDHVQPEVDEQDHGYEPEGHAGTSTASHASQSGHLSIPQSRGTSAKLGYDRKVSAHRISTVPEANEDEYDRGPELEEQALINETGGNHEQRHLLRTPARDQRGSSVPLDTPPQATAPAQGSLSNENTPRTDGGKKKTGGRTSWFPKISRWSETTTSSVAQAFRRSGQSRKAEDETQCRSGASRSGSIDGRSVGPGSIATYSDNLQYSDPYRNPSRELFSSDQPHTGFSQPDLEHSGTDAPAAAMASGSEYQPPMASVQGYANATPEDPKYKVHRDSLNLQHPQPRPGQTERFRANLESQALGFDSTMGPRSTEWAGSATSLHRFPRNPDRDSYNSATDQIRDAHAHQQQHWTSPPGSANMAAASSGPPIPPKEPIDRHATGADSPSGMLTRGTPPRSNRTSNLQKQSPQPRPSVESGYGTMMHGVPTASYVSHSREGFSSPKIENRNLSAALGVPARRPTGPRAMTPKSAGGEDGGDGSERRRKRDTFGSVASQDTDTF